MTKPRKYQIKGVNRIADFGGRAVLADEMGLGKSFQALLYTELNYTAKPVVIVCPAFLKWNWEDECRKHIRKRCEILEGTKPPRIHRILKAPQFVIINYDILWKWLKWLARLDPQLVVIDEPHYIKNRKARRTKATKKLCEDVPHIVALGGTPITKHPSEFWEILHIVRPDVFDSRRQFMFRYCDPKKTPFGWEFKGATNTEELHKLLKKTCMIRRLKKNVLKELPPKTRQLIPIPLSKPTEYKRAEKNFLGWLRDISPGKALRASRAQQFVRSGYLLRLVADLKLRAICEWIDNMLAGSTQKMLVAAIHKKMIKALHEKYKAISVVVDGSVNKRKRHNAILEFSKNKKIKLIIVQQSVAIGWNATVADTVVFVEHGYVPALDEQVIDRIHRFGQTKHCSAYFLYAKDTIEERLCKIKRNRMKVINAVLDGGDVGEDYSAFDQLIEELRQKEKKPK